MSAVPKIDVRDLGSVRRAAKETAEERIVLGEDWVRPDARERRGRRRNLLQLKSSPLARKIITFNLVAVIVMVAGMLYLAPSRDHLAYQRANGMVSEAELIADVFEAALVVGDTASLGPDAAQDVARILDGLDLRRGVDVYVFAPDGTLIGEASAGSDGAIDGLSLDTSGTLITNGLNALLEWAAALIFPDSGPRPAVDRTGDARLLVDQVLQNGTTVDTASDAEGRTVLSAATSIRQGDDVAGIVAVSAATGEIDSLVRREREQMLQMFVLGILVSIGLSLVLASTIANPLAELASAAERGRDRKARQMSPDRIRIPDLTARPDEIGHLSSALRSMVAALYDRIEGNEQFAADVAHEIKNPLASLRSAVGTLRIAKRDDQRETLLDVIDHDVSRLDRLVSDISSASRLDSELVKEEEESFDLLKMLGGINTHLGRDATAKGVDFISDLPSGQIEIQGLEGRLAQVFVNLISNAISFCDDGDAIRVWARKRQNRVLVVVEDTGPGIPDGALVKIFQRFYSERPEGQFGNNSGLGLAISKQIVEAHGGVIWAENIRPTDTDPTSEALGARFVVGLPV